MIDSFVTAHDINKEIKKRGISENQIINICESLTHVTKDHIGVLEFIGLIIDEE